MILRLFEIFKHFAAFSFFWGAWLNFVDVVGAEITGPEAAVESVLSEGDLRSSVVLHLLNNVLDIDSVSELLLVCHLVRLKLLDLVKVKFTCAASWRWFSPAVASCFVVARRVVIQELPVVL